MIISHSEVDTFLGCRRLHYYRYALGLFPKKVSRANNIGNFGHYVLEYYYKALKDGASSEDAYEAGMQAIMRAFGHEDPDIVELVSSLFSKYYQKYSHETELFEIVDVEGVHLVPVTDDITYGLTLDLLVRYIKGPLTGQYAVIDHKFKYNFFTADELSMHAQTFKYIWALQKKGYPIKRSILNQIRYREDVRDVTKLFRRVELVPTSVQLDNIMAEHMQTAQTVHDAKTQPVAWYAQNAPRRLNSRDCQNCYFRVPCRQELLGVDASLTLATMYTPEESSSIYRQYGYN